MRIWSAGRRRSGPRRLDGLRSTRGFTLIELVVVLTIVALAVSVTLPSVGRGLGHWRLKSAVREVATLLKFTRNQSVVTRRPLQVVLDRSRQMYWLDRVGALVDAEQAQAQGLRLYALPAGVRFGEVTVGGRPVVEERVGLVFLPPGGSNGGQVQIVDEGSHGYHIVLDAVTGRATITRLKG